MSITQQLAHWFIALGLDPAMSVLLALILLGAVPLMVAAGIVALFEEDEDDRPRITPIRGRSGRKGVRL